MTVDEAAQAVLSRLVRAGTPEPFVEVEIAADAQGRYPASGVVRDHILATATEAERTGKRLAALSVALKGIDTSKGVIRFVVEG